MIRRESGLVLSCSTTWVIWSMWRPSGAGQERHWTPYTGPRSPSGRAHSSQIVTPRSCSQRALPSPRRNQRSSRTIERRCTFLVVTSGNPSPRSKRIWWPKTLFVPVPVRSALATPWSRTWRRKSSYCERTGRVATTCGEASARGIAGLSTRRTAPLDDERRAPISPARAGRSRPGGCGRVRPRSSCRPPARDHRVPRSRSASAGCRARRGSRARSGRDRPRAGC